LATDLSKTINPASASFTDPIDKLKDEDGSGELPHDVLPPAIEISEGIVDNNALPSSGESDAADATSQPRLTKMMPYARVVLPQQSTSLRTLCLNHYHVTSHFFIDTTLSCILTHQFCVFTISLILHGIRDLDLFICRVGFLF